MRDNLVKARGSIVFLIGITFAFGTVFTLERWNLEPISVVTLAAEVAEIEKVKLIADKEVPSQGSRQLTQEELAHANIAWQYFVNNTNADTGLANSADKYPASTLWDTSSYLLGLIAAHRIGVVDRSEFGGRVDKLLSTLANMPLFDNQLPNKSYSTIDASMVTYNNDATARGIGWSAIDIGRILVPFNVLTWHYPEFARDVNRVVMNWDLDALVRNAEMIGAAIGDDGQTIYLQEGRLGYEEYAAKSLMLAGLDLSLALDYQAYFEYVQVNDVPVGTDLRIPDKFEALNAVVSEPYVLDGLEYGWDRFSKSLAYGVYRAQQARYEQTGVLTAVSEDNIDEAPFFVYNTVFADGKSWNTVTESGADASEFRSISTKTVFGLHALYNTEYTKLLMDEIESVTQSDGGWYSGIYEASGEVNKSLTANTNGIILESLHYIKFGPMLSRSRSSQMALSEE